MSYFGHGLLLATLLLLLSPLLVAASLRWKLGLLGLPDTVPTPAAVLLPTALFGVRTAHRAGRSVSVWT
jgi:hypothetical protein